MMANKKKIPQKLRDWIDVRKKYHLTDAQIQMARERGLNPKKFGSLANHKQEAWKLPLPEYIEALYEKRFNRASPERVLSIEELVKQRVRKKEQRKGQFREDTHELPIGIHTSLSQPLV